MVTVVSMFLLAGAVLKTPSPSSRPSRGAVRRRRGKAPFPLGERNALLMRSVKSAFTLLSQKVTKARLTPERK